MSAIKSSIETAPATPPRPSRRTFLKGVAIAATTPFFLTLGAKAGEQSAFERAQRYLGTAANLVARARDAEGEQRRSLAMEARPELMEARQLAGDSGPAEREQLKRRIQRLEGEVEDLLDD